MRTTLRSRISLLFMSFALMLALPAVAFADNTVADGDGLAPLADNNMAFGSVCSGVESSKSAPVFIKRNGDASTTNINNNVFANSSTATVTITSVTGAGLSAQMGTPNTITLPSDWSEKANNTDSASVSSTVKLNSSVAGAGSGTVTYSATGKNAAGGDVTRTDTMNVSWTTSSCDTTAPDTGITQGPSGTVNSSSATFEFNSTEANSTFETRLDNGAWVANGTATSKAYNNLTDGSHTFDVRATDAAGNVDLTPASRSWTVQTDSTPPVITPNVQGTLGNNGWYTSDVTVTWNVTDDESNVTSPACGSTTISSDTAGQTVTCSATSAGGTDSQSVTIKRDATRPVISADGVKSGTLGLNGWYTTDVGYGFTASDSLSGLATADKAFTKNITTEGSAQKVSSGTVSDLAGNQALAIDSPNFKIDKTAPVNVSGTLARLADLNGWYNAPVNYSFSGTDATSGIGLNGCSSGTYSGPDGTGLTVSGSCADLAGNSATGSTPAFKFDDTNPTLNPSVSPNPVLLNGTATASANAADATSLVASQNCDTVITSSVGAKSVMCYATDNAGNSASASASYNVHYNFSGFFQPIDNKDAAGNYILNKAKAGSTVPVKFSLGGDQGLNIFADGYPKVSPAFTCGASSTDLLEEYSTATTSGLKYDPVANQYIYNMKTDTRWAGQCRQLIVTLADGTTHRANFNFFK